MSAPIPAEDQRWAYTLPSGERREYVIEQAEQYGPGSIVKLRRTGGVSAG